MPRAVIVIHEWTMCCAGKMRSRPSQHYVAVDGWTRTQTAVSISVTTLSAFVSFPGEFPNGIWEDIGIHVFPDPCPHRPHMDIPCP